MRHHDTMYVKGSIDAHSTTHSHVYVRELSICTHVYSSAVLLTLVVGTVVVIIANSVVVVLFDDDVSSSRVPPLVVGGWGDDDEDEAGGVGVAIMSMDFIGDDDA